MDATATVTRPISRPPSQQWKTVLAALVVADVTAAFETMMILSALRVITAEFGSPADVAWLVTAYLLVSAAAAAICGRLGDLYGRKRVLIIVLAMAAGGSILSASLAPLGWIIAGRAVQGVAGAVLPLCYGILRDEMPNERRAVAGGVLISASAVGALLGLVVGGLIVDNLAWRGIFWASGSFAILAALMVARFVPASERATDKVDLDLLGGALFVSAVAGLLLLVSYAGSWGLLNVRTGSLAAVSIGLMIWWVVHELSHANPLLDVRLLAKREILFTNLTYIFTAAGPMQTSLFVLLLLQQSPATGIGFGLTAAAAGALKIPAHTGSLLVSPIAGHLCKIRGERWVIAAGLILNCVGVTTLFFFHDILWVVVIVTMMSTSGAAAVMVGVANNITRVAPAGQTSAANGINNSFRSVSFAYGAQIVTMVLGGAIMAEKGAGSSGVSAVSSYHMVFAIALAFGLLSLIFALMIPKPTPITDAAPA